VRTRLLRPAPTRVLVGAGALLAGGVIVVALGAPPTAISGSECFNRAPTITSNDEFVLGTEGADVIVTGAAANGVVADYGNDRACTDGGRDFVRGDLGNDRIDLGPGKDKASGGDLDRDNPSGNDIIRGGGGDDELNGHDGADVLNGGPGTDICRGGPGADDIINCEH
jgi:Ca2+-binding RTX toxin-like protein